MHINKPRQNTVKFIVMVQMGQVAFAGTWFSNYSAFEVAQKEFYHIIEEDKAIQIQTSDESGMYIHIGPGMVVMFMTEKAYQSLQTRQKIIQP